MREIIITAAIVRAMRPDLAASAIAPTLCNWRAGRRLHRDTALALYLAHELAKRTGESVEDVLRRVASL